MANADEGIISISYRPLTTMDELHVLILAAISEQASARDLSLLERIFSLPRNVIVKEATTLMKYGLVQKVGGKWTATVRGQRLTAVWKQFQNHYETDLRTNGEQWLLGPGKFALDEMIRDKDEIKSLARYFGVADTRSAVKFLRERRQAAERFEVLLRELPSQLQNSSKPGIFGETLVFDNLYLAETDDALMRLEELLATHIGTVVDGFKQKLATADHATDIGNAEAAVVSLRNIGEDIMKKFEADRRAQRWKNQHLAKVKTICEALLADQWLFANVASLVEVFASEPAAFVFRSSVPFEQRKAPKKPTKRRRTRPPTSPTPKKEEDGVIQSLFRWLFA